MRGVQYHEINCKTALNRLSAGRLPFSWDLNIYRGCLHGCRYCYAMYSHSYLASASAGFFDDIHIKTNIVDALEKQLRAPSWRQEVINIGGVTDSYQPIEAKYQLIPAILRLLIKYRTPAIISTKSTLILRDIELIDELSRVAAVNVAATIISVDTDLIRRLEPRAAKPASRFAMLGELKKTQASIGVHLMPLIPYLNDSEQDLDRLFAMARETQVDYLLPGLLYLRGQTRSHFFDFIRREFPAQYQPLFSLYHNRAQRNQYKTALYQRIGQLFRKHGLSRDERRPLAQRLAATRPADRQLSLF